MTAADALEVRPQHLTHMDEQPESGGASKAPGSSRGRQRHRLDTPRMRTRLKSAKRIAFKFAIDAGRDPDWANDVASKVMWIVARRLSSDAAFLADERERTRYVKSIVRNAVINEWERADVRKRAEPVLSYGQETEASSYYNPESILDEMELEWQKRQANAAIAELSQRRRQLVLDHHIEGIQTKDLATASGTTDGTVRVILHNALQEIRERVGERRGPKNRRRKNNED